MQTNKKRKEKDPKNIGGIPYSFKELINWILKHAIVDFYYPFMFLIYFMFVTSVVTVFTRKVTAFWYIFFSIGFLIFAILFIQRMLQRRIHRIENIGDLNEDGWREFEFSNLSLKFPQLKPENVIYRIGFVGDIMKLDEINEGKRGGIAAQNHKKDILPKLKKIFKISEQFNVEPKWLLCVSNNHSADYGEDEFNKSQALIDGKDKFIAFGDVNKQSYTWGKNNEKDDINIVTGTMWSNSKINPSIARFKECNKHQIPGKFNILYPHWHYENECYVRSKIQRKSISLKLINRYENRNWLTIYEMIKRYTPEILLEKIVKKIPLIQRIQKKLPYFRRVDVPISNKYEEKWNIIYGHHPHVPQPIINYGTGILAYSGGNFTSSKRRKKHISGLIMKCEIGQVNESAPLILGKVHWCYTINERIKRRIEEEDLNVAFKEKKRNKKNKEVTVIIDCQRTRKNYFENRSMRFRMNLIIFSIALGGWLGYFWVFFSIHYIYWILYALLIVFEIIYAALKNVKFRRK
ncbi:MAG: hypothetical protein ACXAEX_04530 [Promethearchaeota archaeon]|jgi:hypothetical protein